MNIYTLEMIAKHVHRPCRPEGVKGVKFTERIQLPACILQIEGFHYFQKFSAAMVMTQPSR